MGSYATTTSISLLLPGFLKSDTTTSDTNGTNIFSTHVDRAEGKINAALSSRYSLPFSPVPPMVRTLTEDIASYWTMRGVLSQDGKQKNQYLDDFRSALDTLKLIVSGEMALAYTDGSLVSPRSTSKFLSSHENYTPIFGMDDPDSWSRDADEIEDQEAARD